MGFLFFGLSNNVIFFAPCRVSQTATAQRFFISPQMTYNREIAKRAMFNANMCNKAI